jgi:hypothetical protein
VLICSMVYGQDAMRAAIKVCFDEFGHILWCSKESFVGIAFYWQWNVICGEEDVVECLGYGIVEGSDDGLSNSGFGLICYLLCSIDAETPSV